MRRNDSTPLRKLQAQEVTQDHSKSLEQAAAYEPQDGPDPGRVIDVERLLVTVDGDAEFLKELCELFVSSYPDLMSELDHAITVGHVSRVQSAAHQLKGMLANFAAGPAVVLSQEIENYAKDGKLQNVHRPFCRLQMELGRVRTALESLIQLEAD